MHVHMHTRVYTDEDAHTYIHKSNKKSYLSFSVKFLTLGDGKLLVKVTPPAVSWSSDPEHLRNAR